MTYDLEDEDKRLGFVKTVYPNYNGAEVKQIHKLFYGDYLTSDGETIINLQKVRQSTDIGVKVLEDVKIIRSCAQCPVFDDLDKQLMDMRTLNPVPGST